MHTLGSTFMPPGIHAGGLRYHGMAPLVSHVRDLGLIEAVTSVQQLDAFAAGIQFARAEGIIPAPEANHAVAGAIAEALKCKGRRQEKTILFNLCGHGHFDMQSYHRLPGRAARELRVSGGGDCHGPSGAACSGCIAGLLQATYEVS
jgi:tryptophan synthase beta chain